MTSKQSKAGEAERLAGEIAALEEQIESIASRRGEAEAGVGAAEAAWGALLGRRELGESIPEESIDGARRELDSQRDRLVALRAAATELGGRLAVAREAHLRALKSEIRGELRDLVGRARAVIVKTLQHDKAMTELGAEMESIVSQIGVAAERFREVVGVNPGRFPALHTELMAGLKRNASGVQTGTPEHVAQVWSSGGGWRSLDCEEDRGDDGSVVEIGGGITSD